MGASFIGRVDEVETIEEMLRQAVDGRGSAAVVAGEPGIGKTTLLNHTAKLAISNGRSTGFDVRRATAVPAARFQPFGVLATLLDGRRDQPLGQPPSAEAGRPQPGLAASGTAQGDHESSLQSIFASIVHGKEAASPPPLPLAATAVLTHLAGLAAARPMLLIVDDLQWADQSSSSVLTFVARRLFAERVVLLFGLRAEPPDHALVPTAPDEHPFAVLDVRSLARIDLDHLTHRESVDLLLDLGCAPVPAEEQAVFGGGSPLALVELAERIRAGDDHSEPLRSVPDHFVDLARRLPAEVRAVLLFSALDDDLRTVVAAVGDTARAMLGEAEDRAVIRLVQGRIEFRHPLLRSAILTMTDASAKAAAHERLAQALQDSPDEDRAALHLALSRQGLDDEVAPTLAAFAERARRRGALDEAVYAYERAAALRVDDNARARHLSDAGKAVFFAGDTQRALTLAERALAFATEAPVRADIELLIANAAMWERSPEANTARLQGVIDQAADAAPLVAAWAAVAVSSMAFLRGTPADGVAYARRAEAFGTTADDAVVRLAASAMTSWNLFLSGELVESSQRLDELTPFLDALIDGGAIEGVTFGHTRAMRLIMQERFDEADDLLRRLLPLSHRLAVRLSSAISAAVLGNLLWRRGRWTEAYAYVTQDLEEGGLPPLSTAWAAASAAFVAASLGRESDTERYVDLALAHLPSGEVPLVRAWAHAARGHLALSRGDAEGALASLRTTADLIRSMELGQPEFFLWSGDYLDALVLSGAIEDAHWHVAELVRLNPGEALSWVSAVTERTLGALCEDRNERDRLFASAVERLEQAGMPFEVARTQLRWAQVQHARGESDIAVGAAAQQGFRRLGARLWMEQARRHEPFTTTTMATVTRPDSSTDRLEDVLSAAELKVALCIASGRSNREAATELYLSVRTVGYHLQSVYRKLGVNTRTGLMRRLGSARLDDSS